MVERRGTFRVSPLSASFNWSFRFFFFSAPCLFTLILRTKCSLHFSQLITKCIRRFAPPIPPFKAWSWMTRAPKNTSRKILLFRTKKQQPSVKNSITIESEEFTPTTRPQHQRLFWNIFSLSLTLKNPPGGRSSRLQAVVRRLQRPLPLPLTLGFFVSTPKCNNTTTTVNICSRDHYYTTP